MTDFKIIG